MLGDDRATGTRSLPAEDAVVVRPEVGGAPGQGRGEQPATTATPNAACGPHRATTGAPTSGPMNRPIRVTPPRVDIARARSATGAAAVR